MFPRIVLRLVLLPPEFAACRNAVYRTSEAMVRERCREPVVLSCQSAEGEIIKLSAPTPREEDRLE